MVKFDVLKTNDSWTQLPELLSNDKDKLAIASLAREKYGITSTFNASKPINITIQSTPFSKKMSQLSKRSPMTIYALLPPSIPNAAIPNNVGQNKLQVSDQL